METEMLFWWLPFLLIFILVAKFLSFRCMSVAVSFYLIDGLTYFYKHMHIMTRHKQTCILLASYLCKIYSGIPACLQSKYRTVDANLRLV